MKVEIENFHHEDVEIKPDLSEYEREYDSKRRDFKYRQRELDAKISEAKSKYFSGKEVDRLTQQKSVLYQEEQVYTQ